MQTSNSGFHHIRVGDVVVTALNDGVLEASTDWVAAVPTGDVAALLRAGFRAVPPRITISCFLLTIGGRKVLVDTGSGSAMGPEHGLARSHLTALGVAPGDIGTILVTHAHIDHVSGLLDANGAPYFPNAELVIHQAEPAFWQDDANAAQAPAEAKDAFALARRCLGPYHNRTRPVADGAEVLPGVTAQHLPGHTPGHCGWRISSGADTLLIWGDVVHLPAVQFARPDAGMAFDTDIAAGRASRARTFDMAATDRLLVAGMHLDFPTFGHVVRSGPGYAFVPAAWTPAA